MFSERAELFLKFSEARTDLDDAVAFLKRIQPAPPAKVVDLACGGGRLSVELAKWAQDVVAIDLSPEFIRHARRKLDPLPNVSVHQLDMMNEHVGPCLDQADLIVRLYTSLGYFSQAKERDFIASCARRLRAGGALILDTIHAAGLRQLDAARPPIVVEDLSLHEAYVVNPDHRCIDCAWFYQGPSAAVLIPFSLAILELNEIASLMNEAGLTVEAFDGLSDRRLEIGEPTPSGSRITIVGRKESP